MAHVKKFVRSMFRLRRDERGDQVISTVMLVAVAAILLAVLIPKAKGLINKAETHAAAVIDGE